MVRILSLVRPLVLLTTTTTHATQYEQYILAPESRTLHPVAIYKKVNGTVTDATSILGGSNGSVILTDAGAAVTYDFGKNIGGLVSLTVGSKTDLKQYIGITLSESSEWISGVGCDATQDSGIDEPLWFATSGPGTYGADRIHERGGFRYLSLIHNTTGDLEVTGLSVEFTPMPQRAEDELRSYTGFFHCDDELLNRIWYAGAYTVQMCTIDPRYGASLIHEEQINSSVPGDAVPPWTWWLNTTIANSSAVLVDGAKRDRLVWPGDLHVMAPTSFVSTNDLPTIAWSLDSLFALQKADGQLPYAGVGFPYGVSYSATYHLYNLLGVADYYKYANDLPYLQNKWNAWKKGMDFSFGFIDDSGLMNVTSSADWLRFGMGGHNIEANSILYYTINQGLVLAAAVNDSSVVSSWQSLAAGIKFAANSLLWNETAGMYRDNETTSLMPQDGNAWAVVADIPLNTTQASRISSGLISRWGPYGAPAVEAADAISPFISGFEIEAHISAGNTTSALDLMRLQWGFMLDDPRMTNSTFIEGYSSDGRLHYAPYTNDPRISHAHGWATGPVGTLSMSVAGLQLLSAGGATWKVAPHLGDLSTAHAGFETDLGRFEVWTNATSGGGLSVDFSTPVGTTGMFAIQPPKCVGTMRLVETDGRREDVVLDVLMGQDVNGAVEVAGLIGGNWRVRFVCS